MALGLGRVEPSRAVWFCRQGRGRDKWGRSTAARRFFAGAQADRYCTHRYFFPVPSPHPPQPPVETSAASFLAKTTEEIAFSGSMPRERKSERKKEKEIPTGSFAVESSLANAVIPNSKCPKSNSGLSRQGLSDALLEVGRPAGATRSGNQRRDGFF